MTAKITITWNGNDTKVVFSKDWYELHFIEKLDNLKDAILELTISYEEEYEDLMKYITHKSSD